MLTLPRNELVFRDCLCLPLGLSRQSKRTASLQSFADLGLNGLPPHNAVDPSSFFLGTAIGNLGERYSCQSAIKGSPVDVLANREGSQEAVGLCFLLACILAICPPASFLSAHAQLPALRWGEFPVHKRLPSMVGSTPSPTLWAQVVVVRVSFAYISSEQELMHDDRPVQLEPNTNRGNEVNLRTVEATVGHDEQSFTALSWRAEAFKQTWQTPGSDMALIRARWIGKAPVFLLVTTPKPVNPKPPQAIEIGKQETMPRVCLCGG